MATHSSTTARDRAIQYYESLVHGPANPGEATEAYKDVDELAYLLSRVPTFTSRPLKIIVIGAGFSGLALARAVHVGKLPNASVIIYEKNAGVGGTWYENRYPGCACDIPAPNYTVGGINGHRVLSLYTYLQIDKYSWAPNPLWPSYYAKGPDIHKYLDRVADQHGLRKYVKSSHKVTSAQWIEDLQTWRIVVNKTDGRDFVISSPGVSEGETGTTFEDYCDVLVNCSGFFNNWKWPNVADRSKFRGNLCHTAAWPENAEDDLDGKTVALIGNGSSGVQVLPAIIDRVKKVYVHIRSPTWVTTNFAAKFAGPDGMNYDYTEEQKAAWSADPALYLAYRRQIEAELNSRFGLYVDHTPEQKAAREFGVKEMTTKLSRKKDLLGALLPDFAVGCRRTTPGNGYLEALCHPNCEVVWGKVDAFTSDGLITSSGTTTSGIDAIICATGFDLSCAPRFSIIGLNGVDLRERWLKNPHAYLSVTATDMPNYFTMMGPYSPLGHGSVVTSIEMVANYICDLIRKLQTQNYSYVIPKPHIAGAYQKHALAWLARTAWASHCASTYKNGTVDGDLNSLHPGSRLHYFELLSTSRYEDFEWKSLCDSEDLTFAWLATGFTDRERNPTEDTDNTWYLEFDKHSKQIQETDTNGEIDQEDGKWPQ